MTTTNIQALAGRVIESVKIYSGDSDNPVSLEIRCVGGTYFSFDATAVVKISGVSLLARVNGKNGNLENERRRTFSTTAGVPDRDETEQ